MSDLGISTMTQQWAEVFWTHGYYAERFLDAVSRGIAAPETLTDHVMPVGFSGHPEGFVYFLATVEDRPFVKVGFTTNDPRKRIAQLQTGCPYELELMGFVFGSRQMEADFHKKLGQWRSIGEWFEPTPAVLGLIRETLMEPVQ